MAGHVICAGPVYELKKETFGKSYWRNSWLSLDDKGVLTWSKVQSDGNPLATSKIQTCYKDIKFEPSNDIEKNFIANSSLPSHVMIIPMKTLKNGTICNKRFFVKNASHLQGWLESFAKTLSKLEKMKRIQEIYGTKFDLSSSLSIKENKISMTGNEKGSLNGSKKNSRFTVYSVECMPIFWKEFLENFFD